LAVEIHPPLRRGSTRGSLRDAGGAGKPGTRAGARPGWSAGGNGSARQLDGLMRLRPDKAPSISYMEGALLYLARLGRVANADTPGGAKMSAWVNRLA